MTASKTPGETNLTSLLSALETRLHPETFVFLTLPPSQPPPSSLPIQMSFREAEGLTVITTEASAALHRLDYVFPCRMITLDIHSSLAAVGFIAVIATKLKDLQIGVNPVSGYYHDHLFVPVGMENEALEMLHAMTVEAKVMADRETDTSSSINEDDVRNIANERSISQGQHPDSEN